MKKIGSMKIKEEMKKKKSIRENQPFDKKHIAPHWTSNTIETVQINWHRSQAQNN